MTQSPDLDLPTRKTIRVRGRSVSIAAAVLGSLVFSWMFSQNIPADGLAVRQVFFGPGQGIQEQPVYGPGMHLVVPGYERLHLFPRGMQTLDFNDAERSFAAERLGENYHWVPSIRIQTSEGYQVTVDVTVLYRVVDPVTVLQTVGAGRMFETQLVFPHSERFLRQHLGALDAEDFYDDEIRIAKVEEVRKDLSADLAQAGIQVWAVLLREYQYDDRYQTAIENRKIQDQRVFKNQAEQVAATRAAARDIASAEGQANIAVERQRGDGEVMRIRAEADLYYRQKVAEGDLMVALAEAKGTELENQALQAVGAGNIVGLEMAKALEGTRVIMLSTTGSSAVNPLDLDHMLEGF